MRSSVVGIVLLAVSSATAATLAEVQPYAERGLALRFEEGRIIHHVKGQRRNDDKVIISALDTTRADSSSTYLLSSPDDPNYRTPRGVRVMGRKSKGTAFAWKVESWVDGRTVNSLPDRVHTHWVYLEIPLPLTPGRSYKLRASGLAADSSFLFSPTRMRSEAIHVNTLGYAPKAPRKVGYLYLWAGSMGSVGYARQQGKPFLLLDVVSRKEVFRGTIAFRRPKTQVETEQVGDTPGQNFLAADVWECDFSAFRTPGSYVLYVPEVGTSWPFRIGDDVLNPAYRALVRGLYHNRSGIALTTPFTEFVRPAPHRPGVTPGFAGKLQYSPIRSQDWSNEDSGGDSVDLIKASLKGPLESWGWYQDAGDWDGYSSHARIPRELLTVFLMAPRAFADSELNIPESGNGIPDLLDEATWLPRYAYRLRRELLKKGWGTGGLGLRVCPDIYGGEADGVPSYEDQRNWVVAGEDPWSTYLYAGNAAQLALAFQAVERRDPEGVDWAKEALAAYAWASANTKPSDESWSGGVMLAWRAYASAALYRLTGEPMFERQLGLDTARFASGSQAWFEDFGALAVYLTGPGAIPQDKALVERLRSVAIATADHSVDTSEARALRWAGLKAFPMLVGHQTTPWILEVITGHQLVKGQDSQRERRYASAMFTTLDYFLGTNPLNMSWITGVGSRSPVGVFHLDAWYNGRGPGGQGKIHPGVIPYGPWRKQTDRPTGPWDQAWPHTTMYPAVDAWPGAERWFDNRNSPMNSEFTVHQNVAPAAAAFAYVNALARGKID